MTVFRIIQKIAGLVGSMGLTERWPRNSVPSMGIWKGLNGGFTSCSANIQSPWILHSIHDRVSGRYFGIRCYLPKLWQCGMHATRHITWWAGPIGVVVFHMRQLQINLKLSHWWTLLNGLLYCKADNSISPNHQRSIEFSVTENSCYASQCHITHMPHCRSLCSSVVKKIVNNR